jgi:predicted restriction endonuclease
VARLSKEFRYKILERDNFRCRFCNRGGKHSDYILEVHHIVWRRHGGSDNPANLMTICCRCHDILHYGVESGRPYTFTELKNRQGGA